MPATKQEDWKAEAKRLQTGSSLPTNPKDVKVLLQPGTRNSVGNRGLPLEDSMQILEAMQGNLTWRGNNASAATKKRLEELKKRNPKTYRQRLKGLFGGGE